MNSDTKRITHIKPDQLAVVALALSGALPDEQAGGILAAAFAPTRSNTAAPAVDAAKLDDMGKLKALAEAAKNLPIVAWLVDEYDSQDKLHQSVELSPLTIHLDESAEAVALCTVESARAVTDSFAALVAQQAALIERLQLDEQQSQFVIEAQKGDLALQAARIEELETANWISVEDSLLPVKYCLAAYKTSTGRYRIIRAMHVKQYEIEATGDECDSEANDADDLEYIKAGWYECIDNWGDYSSVAVNEGVVTHWMPLPATPTTTQEGK